MHEKREVALPIEVRTWPTPDGRKARFPLAQAVPSFAAVAPDTGAARETLFGNTQFKAH